MLMVNNTVSLVVVAFLWGTTNPLIKQNSKEILHIKSKSKIKQFILELKYLATNIKYVFPMGINQVGSLIYFLTLQSANLSLAVPVANSLTFVFTALTGYLLGEQLPSKSTIIGVLLILIGTTLCCLDSYYQEQKEVI